MINMFITIDMYYNFVYLYSSLNLLHVYIKQLYYHNIVNVGITYYITVK